MDVLGGDGNLGALEGGSGLIGDISGDGATRAARIAEDML